MAKQHKNSNNATRTYKAPKKTSKKKKDSKFRIGITSSFKECTYAILSTKGMMK
jgi:hypothetical protein